MFSPELLLESLQSVGICETSLDQCEVLLALLVVALRWPYLFVCLFDGWLVYDLLAKVCNRLGLKPKVEDGVDGVKLKAKTDKITNLQ